MATGCKPKLIVFDIFPQIPEVVKIDVEDLVPMLRENPDVALVTATNSGVIMGSGVDMAYASSIDGLQQQLRQAVPIANGSNPPNLAIGTGVAFRPRNYKFLFIAVPTMIMPSDVTKTNNAYWATLCALFLARRAGIHTIYIPMLCTGAGKMTQRQAYGHMMQAYDTWLDEISMTVVQLPIGIFYCNLPKDVLSTIKHQQPLEWLKRHIHSSYAYLLE